MMLGVTTEIPLDNETRTALLLFNERLEASALQERADKRVAKAERAKEAAAATVRKLSDDRDASAEAKAEAEAAYKAAVDEYNVIVANPLAGLDQPKKKAPEPDAEAPAEQAEAPLAEVSADEEEPAAPAEAAESE